jgi:hypothetical protein
MRQPWGTGTHEGAFVLELTSDVKENLLHRAHRVLLALGVQVAEARLRLVGDHVMHTLQLTELDGGGLAPRRVSQVLDALRSACTLPALAFGDAAPDVGMAMPMRSGLEARPSVVKAQRRLVSGVVTRRAQPSA